MADSDRTLDAATLAAMFASAGVPVAPDRLETLAPHAESILGGAARLREADVSAVEPPMAFLPWVPPGRGSAR